MPPDLEQAIRKLREQVEARRMDAAKNATTSTREFVRHQWRGKTDTCIGILGLIDTLMREHGIEQ